MCGLMSILCRSGCRFGIIIRSSDRNNMLCRSILTLLTVSGGGRAVRSLIGDKWGEVKGGLVYIGREKFL